MVGVSLEIGIFAFMFILGSFLYLLFLMAMDHNGLELDFVHGGM